MIALVVVLLALAPAAVAAPPHCRVTTSGIAFGRVEALHRASHVSVGEVALACGGGEPASVSVALLDVQGRDRGQDGATVRLYLDAGLRLPWGDGHAGTAVMQQLVPGDGRVVRVPVYARLDVTSSAVAGSQVRNLTLVVSTNTQREPSLDGLVDAR